MKFVQLLILITFLPFCINEKAVAQTKSDFDLDQIILKIKKDKKHNPFSLGEKNALKNPVHQELVDYAYELNTDIEWVNSVSKSVMQLDYVKERMKVKASDEFDGWFDEFTSPNLILIDKKTSLVTLLHEVRHAIHLGVHEPIKGYWFDEYLYKTKKRVQKFQQKVSLDENITTKNKVKVNKCATRVLETASEISAHAYDVELAIAFKNDYLESYKEFIKEYLIEHKTNQACLSKIATPKDLTFASELEKKLNQFMLERGI